jgi:hypothetical protein
MNLEIIIPSVRPTAMPRLLRSLDRLQTMAPSLVTIVTNHHLEPIAVGYPVRQLSFTSSRYAIGTFDVGLRRNIGLWWADDHVLFFDDDQLAPGNLVETTVAALRKRPVIWGNYRYVDWTDWTSAEIADNPATVGRSRETPCNYEHSPLSCYAGLLGAEVEVLKKHGGFDLVYTVGSSEDQNLGMRLLGGTDKQVMIREPPFAWHTTTRLPYDPDPHANICTGEHDLEEMRTHDFNWVRCRRCPFVARAEGQPVGYHPVIMPFEPDGVSVTETWLQKEARA